MRLTAILCALIASQHGALANDSAFDGIGGRARPLKGEHRNVRMESERVQIDVFRSRYEVTADFTFRNSGPRATVAMGFPESGGGDVDTRSRRAKSAFANFSTSVDGRQVSARRTVTNLGEGGYDAFWVKSVPFESGQRRRVRVRYSAPYGGSTNSILQRLALYDFTGGNWKGKVARSDLAVRVRQEGSFILTPSWNDKFLRMKRVGHTLSATWRDWQAQGSFLLGVTPTLRGWRSLAAPGSLPAGGPMAPDANTIGDSRAFIHAIDVAARGGQISQQDIAWAPPFVTRAGILFVSLSAMERVLSDRADKERPGSGEREVGLSWDAAAGMARLRAGRYQAWFRGGSKRGGLRAVPLGRAEADVGTQVLFLSEAPFTVNGQLYVPAAPLLGGMNILARVDERARTVSLRVPSFTQPKKAGGRAS